MACTLTNKTATQTLEECARTGHRTAWVITLDATGARFAHANQTLSSVGFEVRPFTPLDAQADPRVLRMEQQYLRMNESKGVSRGAISLTLTHAELWRSFPAGEGRRWLYVFEDDAMLDRDAEWAARHARHFPCYLEGAERVAEARGSSIIYLGANPGSIGRVGCTPLPVPGGPSPCDS